MTPDSTRPLRLRATLWLSACLATSFCAAVFAGDVPDPKDPMPPSPSTATTPSAPSPVEIHRPALPAIDRAAPSKTETATFALG